MSRIKTLLFILSYSVVFASGYWLAKMTKMPECFNIEVPRIEKKEENCENPSGKVKKNEYWRSA